MAFQPLRIDAEDLDAARHGFAPVVPELAELLGSAGRVVAGVEDQHDALAAQCRRASPGGRYRRAARSPGARVPTGRGSEKSQESIIGTVICTVAVLQIDRE